MFCPSAGPSTALGNVKPNFSRSTFLSQCREFAAEEIGMICVALHFVIDVFGAIDTPKQYSSLCDIVHDE